MSGNGNLIGITDFGLGVLGNNGGPTQTIALLAGSPAIGAGNVALAVDQNGNPLTNDQRGAGYPRTINGLIDIGAFERPTSIGSPTVYTVDLTSADGTGSGDSGDLVYVIEQADANPNLAGSIINFDPTVFGTPQTITLSSPLELAEPSGPLVINGPGANLLTISGNNAVQVFDVVSGAVATMSGLTISEGSAEYGGGIFNANFAGLTLSESVISGSSAVGYGGAIASGGVLTLIDTTVSGDSAQANGGSYAGGLFNVGSATISGSAFTGDTTQNVGGGIANLGVLTVSGSTFSDDSAGNQGGGIYSPGSFTITSSTFSGDSTYYGASQGAGFAGSGTGTISDSTFANDTARTYGGALEYSGSSLVISGSTFDNDTGYVGGAIYDQGTLTVITTTVADNTGDSAGGGIYDYQASLVVINSAIAYNSIGGVDNDNGSASLYNTIVDENSSYDLSGSAFSAASAYNLIGVDATGSISGNGNLVGVTNPDLGSLGDYGGPTETIALLAESPAIDAGSATIPGITVPAVDQRGVPWPRGLVFIGSSSYVIPLAAGTYIVDTTADSGTGSLRAGIEAADAYSGAFTIDFAVGGGLQTITLLSALPNITDPVNLDGESQPAYDGAPLIELAGGSGERC